MARFDIGDTVIRSYIEEFFDKPITQTFHAAVIPRGNLDDIMLCFRP